MGIIAGIYTQTNDPDIHEKLNNMIKSQSHRDNGLPMTYINKNIAICMVNQHDSVSSVNLNQYPELSTKNQDSNIHAFVDGIVLDIPEHIKYFKKTGVHISRNSGTAIVEAAYNKWGLNFMNFLDGEFSCVIWDQENQQIILVRDPYGHKPLHYFLNDNRLIFSSEIKGILAGGVSPQIDLISLNDFLGFNCIPYPATIFKDVFQVNPGEIVVCSRKGKSHHQYWDHKLEVDHSMSLDETITKLTHSIRNAVSKRMVTKDTYCFLSGGIDSSAIISFASEISNKPVHAICVGFEEEEYDESDYAAIMAKHVGAEFHKVIAKPDSFLNMLDTLVYYHDSPFWDTSAYPTYYAAKIAKSYTDIILTGDGPDQTMGGADNYISLMKNSYFKKKNRIKQFTCKLGAKAIEKITMNPEPSILSRIERKLYRNGLSPIKDHVDMGSLFPDIVKKFMWTDDLWQIHLKNNPARHLENCYNKVKQLDDINKQISSHIRFYITDDLMIKVDRGCMAHGLETLSPFQDIDLAKIVNKIPTQFKVNLSDSGEITTKFILKKICQDRFPDNILTKKKQGFAIPLKKWLTHDNGKYIKEILLNQKTFQRGYFRKKSLENFVNVFLENKGDWYYPRVGGMVSLLTLEIWHRKYID